MQVYISRVSCAISFRAAALLRERSLELARTEVNRGHTLNTRRLCAVFIGFPASLSGECKMLTTKLKSLLPLTAALIAGGFNSYAQTGSEKGDAYLAKLRQENKRHADVM